MSRTLSKILVICALVVIVPLMVVGTTLAAYYSIDSSITIAAVIDEKCDAEGTYALVSYDGNHDSTLKVTTGQTKVVEVEAYYTPYAYTFKGWFEGDVEAYNQAKTSGNVEYVSTDKTISVDMSKANNYVAVYEVVRFKISGWDYKNDPSADDTTDKAPVGAHADGFYKYGELLPTLDDTGYYTFEGWQIKNDAKNLRYLAATFGTEYSTAQEESKPIVLTNPWLKSDTVMVTYVGVNDEDLYTEEVTKSSEQAHTLKTPDQIAGLELKNGYEYAWTEVKGGANTTKTVTPSENKRVYLQEKAVEYTATVSSDYKLDKGISFSEVSKDALTQLFDGKNWTTEHAFWKVETVKIVYNGATYDSADALLTAIETANPHADGEIAVSLAEESIHKYFSTISVSKIEVKASEDLDSGAMWQEDVYKSTLAGKGKVEISEINDSNATATVEVAFNLNGRDQWQSENGKSLTFAGLRITGGHVFGTLTVDFNKLGLTVNSTMLDVIDKLVEISPEEILDDLQDVLTFDNIIVMFTYPAE